MTIAQEQPRLKVAIVGLGRMGSIHATNFAYQVPRAQVVAVCDVRQESLDWASQHLPAGVRAYTDAEDMFKTSGAEATLIVTETSRHAPLAELAMSYGLVSLASGFCLRSKLIGVACAVGEAHLRRRGDFQACGADRQELSSS